MKYIYPISIGTALLFVFAMGAWQYHGPSVVPVYTPTDTGTSAPNETINTPPVTSTSTPVTTEPAPSGYTLADVAKHASPSDCWTAINGSVYDLTSFIPNHPGGERIVAVCGIDGTSLFEGQHGSSRRPNNELATLKIGSLIK